MVNMPRLVRGDLGGFTIKESGARATRPLSSKSSRRAALAGFSAGSTVPLTSCIPARGWWKINISGAALPDLDTKG